MGPICVGRIWDPCGWHMGRIWDPDGVCMWVTRGSHMGPRWGMHVGGTWVPCGTQVGCACGWHVGPIWDPGGICLWVAHGCHVGPTWHPYGLAHVGPILSPLPFPCGAHMDGPCGAHMEQVGIPCGTHMGPMCGCLLGLTLRINISVKFTFLLYTNYGSPTICIAAECLSRLVLFEHVGGEYVEDRQNLQNLHSFSNLTHISMLNTKRKAKYWYLSI